MGEKSKFWQNVLVAVESEPKEIKATTGASGYTHPLVALGVHEKRKRVVIISGETDARLASLAQSDMQAGLSTVKMVMARPIAINLSPVAKLLASALGIVTIGQEELERLGSSILKESDKTIKRTSKQTGELLSNVIATPLGAMALNVIAVIKEAYNNYLL